MLMKKYGGNMWKTKVSVDSILMSHQNGVGS